MGFPAKLLGDGEVVVLHVRTHGKALVLPAVVLVVSAGLGGAGWGAVRNGDFAWARWVVLALVLLAVLLWSALPFLRWWGTTYTVTSERLITRTGLVNRTGRDIPLARVNDVAFQQSLWDRVLGCGSLIVSAASEQGSETLHDVPRVAGTQTTLSELVRDAHGWSRTPRHRLASAQEAARSTAERAAAEPSSTETAGSELARPELAGPEHAGPELAGPEIAGSEFADERGSDELAIAQTSELPVSPPEAEAGDVPEQATRPGRRRGSTRG